MSTRSPKVDRQDSDGDRLIRAIRDTDAVRGVVSRLPESFSRWVLSVEVAC